MNLKEKIFGDFKEAFKAKEEMRLSVLKMLQSEIKNAELAKRTKLFKSGEIEAEAKSILNDEEIIEVVFREIKKRKDAIDLYEKGGRPETAKNERKEIEVLMNYLPEQLSEDEVRELAKKAIEQTGAVSQKEMGKVMAVLMPQIKGKADGGMVSSILKELLG
ncbi:GatB/YqeY domain-containing protein [Patescibacteria group bacterium]|nr:GatB/YqeY domain-containing protein [Patescibacteria group bacterium]